MTGIIPGGFDDIDERWLTDVLGIEVTGLEIEELGDHAGFLGDLARIGFDSADGPVRLVAKIPTSDRGGRRVGRLLDVWRREHRFYSELAPAVGDLVPRCWYTAADPDRDRFIVLLDEIAPVREVDQLDGADADDLTLVTGALAELHGCFHDDHGRTPIWMAGIDTGTATLLQNAVVSSLPAWRERYGDLLTPAFVDLLGSFAPRMSAWLAAQASRPLVLCHADVRVANLLFPVGGSVRLIDWQTAMRTNGLTDLAILLGTSATIETRRVVENDLLEHYREGLRVHGVALDEDRLGDDLAGAYLWWSAMFANNLSTIDPPTDRARELFESMVVRTATAALDHGAASLLDSF